MSAPFQTSTQLAVRALAPWLPPSLQTALALLDVNLDVRPSAIVEERMRELVESWRRELQRPLENGYHPQFLDAQSFTQLIILTVDATIRERLSEKRQMYGRILARADSQRWGSNKIGRVEEALEALVRVSEADLRVLNLITARVAQALDSGAAQEEDYLDAAMFSVDDLKAQLTDLSSLGVRTYIARLERLGLLLPGKLDTAPTGGSYIPTHLLEELIALTLPPDPPHDEGARSE